jgi:hypothetical protein
MWLEEEYTEDGIDKLRVKFVFEIEAWVRASERERVANLRRTLEQEMDRVINRETFGLVSNGGHPANAH